MRIGVLALQGAFLEHAHVLRRLGVEAIEVRLPQHLDRLDGLIIPGGESTTIGKLAVQYGLLEPIRDMARAGKAIWGTCAGLILLSKELSGPRGQGADPPLLKLMDITVARNAFGRQVDSFETDLAVPALDVVSTAEEAGRPFHAVFIRAPRIESVGEEVEVLARLEPATSAGSVRCLNEACPELGRRVAGDGIVVAARQGHLLVTAFHPELTADTRFHRYFLHLAG
ncbi:MAG: pyridoxal 5'-phosphate synthase glutaminase subunit PdxT [Anaerolineae bacterium]|nr:pyridoxal 5'-phosphate synthase glutaminase subunit PdxT [Anaerolineae bacterium]